MERRREGGREGSAPLCGEISRLEVIRPDVYEPSAWERASGWVRETGGPEGRISARVFLSVPMKEERNRPPISGNPVLFSSAIPFFLSPSLPLQLPPPPPPSSPPSLLSLSPPPPPHHIRNVTGLKLLTCSQSIEFPLLIKLQPPQ